MSSVINNECCTQKTRTLSGHLFNRKSCLSKLERKHPPAAQLVASVEPIYAKTVVAEVQYNKPLVRSDCAAAEQ